jgi:hypothetical protein
MLKEFQPGLSQGIYEALARGKELALLRGMHYEAEKNLKIVVDFNNNGEDCN